MKHPFFLGRLGHFGHFGLLGLLMLAAPPLFAGAPGRLFFTPAERAQLDAEKYRYAGTDDSAPRYQGLVQRSQGPTTLWINGIPQQVPAAGRIEVGSLPPAPNPPGAGWQQGGKITVHPARGSRRP